MRDWLSAAAAVVAAVVAEPATAQLKPDTAGIETQEIDVVARPIARFARGNGPSLSPRLEWRGGLELSSFSTTFGGWSGLVLDKEGKSLLAVSDSGTWMRGEIAYEGDRPTGLGAVQIGALRTQKGKPLSRARDRDAEAMTLLSGTPAKGKVYIGFEGNGRIGLFDVGKAGLGAPQSYMPMPAETRRMWNDGIEAITILDGGPRKGALVAFAESPLKGETRHRGWIWESGKPHAFTAPDVGGFGITDAASLSGGSVLIVERRFRWLEGLRVRLRLLAADSIEPGGTAKGDVLLEASNADAEIDNLEAVAVSEGAQGETVVTLMSDDNFNRFLQRTVLLQFTLKDAPVEESERPEAKNVSTKP